MSPGRSYRSLRYVPELELVVAVVVEVVVVVVVEVAVVVLVTVLAGWVTVLRAVAVLPVVLELVLAVLAGTVPCAVTVVDPEVAA